MTRRSKCGRLYVGNLGRNVTAAELQTLFAAAGAVKWADVATDARTGHCKGFGFVQMQSLDAARRALATLNGRAIGGRFLTVTEARPKGATASAAGASIGPRVPRPRTGSPRRGYRAAR